MKNWQRDRRVEPLNAPPWKKNHDDYLLNLINDDKATYRQAVESLTARFPDKVFTVGGVKNRLTRLRNPNARATLKPSTGAMNDGATHTPSPPQKPLPLALPTSGKGFLELHGGECKFEISGQTDRTQFRFCGCPIVYQPPYAYCEHHRGIAYYAYVKPNNRRTKCD